MGAPFPKSSRPSLRREIMPSYSRDFSELSCEARLPVTVLADCAVASVESAPELYCGQPAVADTGGMVPVCAVHLRLYRYAVGLDPDTGSVPTS